MRKQSKERAAVTAEKVIAGKIERIAADLCVIGAGAAGLSVAAGAAGMGARVVLIEQARMGGECLNSGCVPSKALLAAAHAAQAVRTSQGFGLDAGIRPVSFERVRDHVRAVIAGIAPHDSVERFEGLGVRVIRAHACFTGTREVDAEGRVIRARRFVVATGSAPLIPPIQGLDAVPFLTNETVFELADLPQRLLVLGGGPVGCELAQAFARLGTTVTLLERTRLLPAEDADLVAVLRERLRADGVEVREGTEVRSAYLEEGEHIGLVLREAWGESRITGTHLLIAAGRTPRTPGLGLEAAGIIADANGIRVDARLRTSNRRVFALGDVTPGPRFTHAAGHQAGIVLRNALLRWPARCDRVHIPRVTYTEPELASVGLGEAEARAVHRGLQVVHVPFAENDRARAERQTEGMVKVLVSRRGRVLGATILGRSAGELIQPWQLAVDGAVGLAAIARFVAPYPTLGEANRRAAARFFEPLVFGRGTRRLVRLLARLG